jgi:hypothetical protein
MTGWDIAGWLGAVLIIFAYVMVTKRPSSRWFRVVNLVGGAALVVNGIGYRDTPYIALNLVWASVALVGLWMWRREAASARNQRRALGRSE